MGARWRELGPPRAATDAASVTVEIRSFDVLAAGVRTDRILRTLCGGSGQPACGTTISDCSVPGADAGFCVQTVMPTVRPESGLFQRGNLIYFSGDGDPSPTAQQIEIVRMSSAGMPTGMVRGQGSGFCNAHLPNTNGLDGDVAIDGAGNLWNRTCRFTFGAGVVPGTAQDFPLQPAGTGAFQLAQFQSVTTLANGNVLQLGI